VPIALITGKATKGDPETAGIIVSTVGAIKGRLSDQAAKIKSRRMKEMVYKLENFKMLVIDEADAMISQDGGQQDDVTKLVAELQRKNPRFQRILFSATYEVGLDGRDDVWTYATKTFAPRAATLQMQVNKADIVLDTVKHCFVRCNGVVEKEEFVIKLFEAMSMRQAIIFCNWRNNADSLARKLEGAGFKDVRVSHGGMDAFERRKTLQDFTEAKFKVLISTNMISRGVDIPMINVVVNYDLPLDRRGRPNGADYLHRVGRASRFGRHGVGVNLIASAEDWKVQQDLERYWENRFEVEHLDVSVDKLTKDDDDEKEKLEDQLKKYLEMGNKHSRDYKPEGK